MNIGVYGSGYLATVVSACLADFGVPVTCMDEDAGRLELMAQARVPYFEKNLEEIMRRNVRAGRLTFTSELSSLSRHAQIIYLAQDSSSYIEETAVRLSRLASDKILVICTPVPVGTASRVERRVQESGNKITVVSQPMFLTDGCAVEDFNWPDRVLLGTKSPEAVAALKQLYRPLVMRGVPVIVTNHETAELAREASTAFVATKISFINEISGLCEHVNADSVDLALALGLDKRIAPRCLQPGAGFGGPFVEEQMDSLAQLAYSKGVGLKVLGAAREVNRMMCDRVVSKITGALQSVSGKQVGLLGLSFKPNTNSVAGSASMELAKRLLDRGARVKAFDPVAIPDARGELDIPINYCESPYAAAEDADALVVGTGWPEFRSLDYGRIKRSLRQPLIVDTKNLLDPARMRSMGFEYLSMGRA